MFFSTEKNKASSYCVPRRDKDGDAGYDLTSCESKWLPPLVPRKIKTNICVAFPKGRVFLLRDRSGMGSRGFHVLAGVVDPNYRGEICVVLINLNLFNPLRWFKKIKVGDKVCQGLLVHVDMDQRAANYEETLDDTERGERGFGSSGR